MSSSPYRRRRLRRLGELSPPPDWAELPIDAMLSVLHKLDPIELLVGCVARVCRSWRRAAREEPELWRRIDMRLHSDLRHLVEDRQVLAMAAVRLAAGRCEAFWGEDTGGDDFLLLLAAQAPFLKSLRLISCYDVTNEGLMKAVNKFPLLEALELSRCKNVFGKVYEGIGKACPRLKHLRVSHPCFYSIENVEFNKDEESLGIATMSALRTLQLIGSELTNVGLMAILDNCPLLECLDIRHCFNIYMDANLRAKCAGIKTMKLPHDSIHGYKLPIGHPVRTRSTKTRRQNTYTTVV